MVGSEHERIPLARELTNILEVKASIPEVNISFETPQCVQGYDKPGVGLQVADLRYFFTVLLGEPPMVLLDSARSVLTDGIITRQGKARLQQTPQLWTLNLLYSSDKLSEERKSFFTNAITAS